MEKPPNVDEVVAARQVMKEADYSRFDGDTCCLDGWFTVEELEAALVLLRAGEDDYDSLP